MRTNQFENGDHLLKILACMRTIIAHGWNITRFGVLFVAMPLNLIAPFEFIEKNLKRKIF